jgi:hypothetical protein
VRAVTLPPIVIPERCSACGEPILMANLHVDDGCPCNSPRGVNFPPTRCGICNVDDCVKPGHRLTWPLPVTTK